MLKSIKRFKSDEDGNIAIIFGLTVIPFMMVAGMAVDYGRGVVAKHELQVALDNSVLAAGSLRLAADADRKALGKAYFEANFPSADYGLTVPENLIAINNNVISADQSVKVKTAFMQVASLMSGKSGIPRDMDLSTKATALVPQVGKAEISLVLDYSGSMDDMLGTAQKYVTMRDAAKDLINGLHSAAGGSSSDIEFALVPFSYGVKAELMGKHLTDTSYDKLSGDTRIESCLSGRKKNNTTDTEPVDGKRHRWQQTDLWYDKGSYNETRASKCSTMLLMRELTSTTGVLLSDLNNWEPYGGTHISSGFQFGWHSISPNSVFAGGAAYDKINHEDPEQRVMKAIVLLTDGAQTVPAYRKNGNGQDNPDTSDPSWPMDKSNGEYNLEQQCTNAKDEGIIVVTVAFDLDDDDTVDRLHDCASLKNSEEPDDGRYAFTANTTSQLQTAFQEIGDILAEMVYLSN